MTFIVGFSVKSQHNAVSVLGCTVQSISLGAEIEQKTILAIHQCFAPLRQTLVPRGGWQPKRPPHKLPLFPLALYQQLTMQFMS